MSKQISAIALALIISAGAAASASAAPSTLLCRFAKFTVTESSNGPGKPKTIREQSLKIPRSILVTIDPVTGAVFSPQANMLLEDASLHNGQVSGHIRYVSDNSWLFGEEVDGAGALIIDVKNQIGSVMTQLKSEGSNKMALSAGRCREFRMQTPEATEQVQASIVPTP